jgi:hypothetical protein
LNALQISVETPGESGVLGEEPTLRRLSLSSREPENGNGVAWIVGKISAVVSDAGANKVFFKLP